MMYPVGALTMFTLALIILCSFALSITISLIITAVVWSAEPDVKLQEKILVEFFLVVYVMIFTKATIWSGWYAMTALKLLLS